MPPLQGDVFQDSTLLGSGGVVTILQFATYDGILLAQSEDTKPAMIFSSIVGNRNCLVFCEVLLSVYD